MALLLDGIRSTCRGARVLLFVPLLSTAFPTTGLAQSTNQATVNWIRENAVHLDYEDWHDIDIEDLSFLDEALEGKRIVYLGVSDHWVHETISSPRDGTI
jgi:hypothetical protein